MKPTTQGLLALLTMIAGCGGAPGGGVVTTQSVGDQLFNYGTLTHPGACLDAAGAGTANGTQLQEWWCNGGSAQSFDLQSAGGGAYSLVNPNANKCVDVSGSGTANGTKVQLWDCNGTGAQKFTLRPVNGFVSFVNSNSGKCLDVAGNNPADGTKVQLWDCNGSSAQQWNPAVVGTVSGGGTTTPPASGWKLVWSDEFNGARGSVDGSKWGFETGNNGWGNNELEYYTNRTNNVLVDGAGNLEIIARRENYGSSAYTSGRINTSGRFTQTYGRIEARIKIPSGAGMWPAFWMLGSNIGSVGWPSCGEIDIMEAVINFSINHGTIHGPGYSGAAGPTGTYQNNGSLANDFHVYAVEWDAGQIRWYVDGNLFETRTPADAHGNPWVYNHPFYILLNVAVGGNWPGPPDGSTQFPQTMLVDYVRVYSR